jgi:multiple sugar transport system permease protein
LKVSRELHRPLLHTLKLRRPYWGMKLSTQVGHGLAHLFLMACAVLFLIPFAWMLSTSLKEFADISVFPPQWIPDPIMWSNYPEALTMLPFGRFAFNTAYITILGTLGTVLSSSLVAFAFARLRFPGRDPLFLVLLSTMMLPGVVTLIPVFVLFRYLGWINTPLPLIVPHFFGGGAFNVFLLRQYFSTIPLEMDDAARIDGCNTYSLYWRIIIPQSMNALAIVGIFTFMGMYHDFLGPLLYLKDLNQFTIAVGLNFFRGLAGTWGQTYYHWMMAVATVAMIPPLIIFFIAQRYFIQGIVITGVKG